MKYVMSDVEFRVKSQLYLTACERLPPKQLNQFIADNFTLDEFEALLDRGEATLAVSEEQFDED